jgi:hypothetical protein
MCDGEDGVFGVSDTLGGLDASAFARRAERNSFSAGNANVPREFTDGATITLDTELANVWFGTLGGTRDIELDNETDGSWLDLYFQQDATGGRQIDDWPGNVVWENGEQPEFPGTPNTTDLVQLQWIEDLALSVGTPPRSTPRVAARWSRSTSRTTSRTWTCSLVRDLPRVRSR